MIGRLFSSGLGWALVAGVALGTLGTVAFFNTKRPAFAAGAEPAVLSVAEANVLATLDGAVTKLTENITPSVVHVRGTRGSEGSGVVYKSDGWIITNSHVVQGAEKANITFADGRRAEGRVIFDDMSDIAVVKTDRKDLRPASFADSELVKPGQIAIAIGSPLGFEQSVTFGHVSATGRSTSNPAAIYALGRPYFDMIQTDAAINPGNSGGPLMNYKGEVIGINTYIASNTGMSTGVGFAIQSNTAKVVADQLIASGKVTRGYLGVVPGNLLGYERQEKKVQAGAIIREISPDGPAAKSGLKVGDVVTKINGSAIRGEMDFRNAMIINKPGAAVSIGVIRDGKPQTISVKLSERPSEPVASAQPPRGRQVPGLDEFNTPPFPFGPREESPDTSPPTKGGPAKLGVSVRELTSEEKSSGGMTGVYVVSVENGSVAARAGVRPGMVITQLGSTMVTSPAQLHSEVAKFKVGDRTTISFGKVDKNARTTMSISIRF